MQNHAKFVRGKAPASTSSRGGAPHGISRRDAIGGLRERSRASAHLLLERAAEHRTGARSEGRHAPAWAGRTS